MTAAVVQFPGSNCDRDMAVAITKLTGKKPEFIWHAQVDLPQSVDFIALPGGFSYGDYLRSGAMAARAPIMKAVISAANRGVPVLGVCNGFQILCETGLLPGALMRNAGLNFVCRTVPLITGHSNAPLLQQLLPQQKLHIPVAHHDGNYFIDSSGLQALKDNGQIAFRYGEKVNGSVDNIAGVTNRAGNILGMMPHPERAIDHLHGGTDGRVIMESVLSTAMASA